jgi:hypothetical protein
VPDRRELGSYLAQGSALASYRVGTVQTFGHGNGFRVAHMQGRTALAPPDSLGPQQVLLDWQRPF